VSPFDFWTMSEEDLLRAGRDALWLENYQDACDALSEYCSRLKSRERPIAPAVLAYYALALGHARNVREGVRVCREALSQDRRNPNIYLCLARLYVFAESKKNAVEVLAQGLRCSRSHRGLNALRRQLGIRQRVPIPFLGRQNAVNVKLGRALSKLKGKSASP
jgi:hypothetical protein